MAIFCTEISDVFYEDAIYMNILIQGLMKTAYTQALFSQVTKAATVLLTEAVSAENRIQTVSISV